MNEEKGNPGVFKDDPFEPSLSLAPPTPATLGARLAMVGKEEAPQPFSSAGHANGLEAACVELDAEGIAKAERTRDSLVKRLEGHRVSKAVYAKAFEGLSIRDLKELLEVGALLDPDELMYLRLEIESRQSEVKNEAGMKT